MPALVLVGVLAEHVLGDDQPEHGVAEELEALVGLVARILRAPAAVAEGTVQQPDVGEGVAEALRERSDLVGGAQVSSR